MAAEDLAVLVLPAVWVLPLPAAAVLVPVGVVVSPEDEMSVAEALVVTEVTVDKLLLVTLAVVPLVAGPVKLLFNSRSGVKLYWSGPTLATLAAGPTMIWTA